MPFGRRCGMPAMLRWSSSASMASQKAGDSSPSNRHTYRWCTLQCEHLLLILPPSSSRMSTPWKLGKVRQSARCFECRPPHPRHNLLPQRPHRRCGGRGGGCSSEPGDCSGIASADEASAEPAFRVVELWVELWELSPCLMGRRRCQCRSICWPIMAIVDAAWAAYF